MELPLYHIDTFTSRPFAGNPAAVCLLPEWLSDQQLQTIAAENYLPVTSFIIEKENEYHLRWFSPTQEYDLCGHGTLAAAFVILQWVKPWLNEIYFHSASGVLPIKRSEKNIFWMDFPARVVSVCAMIEELQQVLGSLPRQLFKGPWWHIAIMESERQIRLLKPDFMRMAQVGCEKLILTAPGDRVDFVSRYFNAKGPIYEDAATGSIHCSLMPYWARRLNKTHLTAKQVSARGGEFECELKHDRVAIKGGAVVYAQGTLQFPVE